MGLASLAGWLVMQFMGMTAIGRKRMRLAPQKPSDAFGVNAQHTGST
jgi:hypothetical protein